MAKARPQDARSDGEGAHLRPQLLLLALRVTARGPAGGRKRSREDALSLAATLAKQRVALEVVFFGGRRGAQLTEIVLQVAEVIHNLRNAYGAGIVHWRHSQ